MKQTTLDDLFEIGSCGLGKTDKVYLLKIDCEGHDGFVLEGARELLKAGRVKYLIFEHSILNDAQDLQGIVSSLWEQGYGCFVILDRLLVPISAGWWHPAYRDRRYGGVVTNMDVLCASPHDVDLRVVIQGFASHTHAKRAADIALEALDSWRALKPRVVKSVSAYYDVAGLAAKTSTDPSMQHMLIGDLLRNGYAAEATRREQRSALVHFRKAARLGQARGGPGEDSWAHAAVLELATCYHFGDCAPVNLEAASYWYSELEHMSHWVSFLSHLALLHLGNVSDS